MHCLLKDSQEIMHQILLSQRAQQSGSSSFCSKSFLLLSHLLLFTLSTTKLASMYAQQFLFAWYKHSLFGTRMEQSFICIAKLAEEGKKVSIYLVSIIITANTFMVLIKSKTCSKSFMYLNLMKTPCGRQYQFHILQIKKRSTDK